MNQLWTVELPAVATIGTALWPIVRSAKKLAGRRHDELLTAVRDLDGKVEKIDRRVMGLELRARRSTKW